MAEIDSVHLGRHAPPSDREGPQKVQAFIASHQAFFVLLGVLLAQLLLLSFQISRNNSGRLVKVWAVAVFQPFQRSLRAAVDGTSHSWSTLKGLWHAQQENQELRREITADRTQIQKLSEKAAEADHLRALLDFKNQTPFETIAAEVIAASPGEGSNAVFIDKGSDSGLRPDTAVITPTGVVGKIIAVFPQTAQVLLITDPSSGVGALLADTRVQGVVKGAGQNLCQMHYVMNEEKVSVGEEVLTSGLDQIYPKGLSVGRVIRAGEGNIYKTIIVQPAAALDRLETVLVAMKPATAERPAPEAKSSPQDKK